MFNIPVSFGEFPLTYQIIADGIVSCVGLQDWRKDAWLQLATKRWNIDVISLMVSEHSQAQDHLLRI